MDKKIHSVTLLALLLIGMSTVVFYVAPVSASLSVHNIDTGEDFATIQGAIDDSDTLDGHTILVDAGVYYEHLEMSKSLRLTGENPNNTIIDGQGIETFLIKIDADNVTVSGFTLQNNGQTGIWFYGRNNNSVSNTIITNNTGHGIYIGNSEGNVIFNNRIINNGNAGIRFDWCSHSLIHRNEIVHNAYGIVFMALHDSKSCTNNTIKENEVRNNPTGIQLFECSANYLHHNNLVNNTQQVYSYLSLNTWYDSYPSGGNYWSDYENRYPDAQELDDSGIWDTPYLIDENNQDNYPLMKPWTSTPPIPTTIGELTTEIEKCWSEGEIDNQGIVRSLIAKLSVAQKLVDKGKIEEAKSILEEGFIPQVENLSSIHITLEAAEILIKSAEYIISHL